MRPLLRSLQRKRASQVGKRVYTVNYPVYSFRVSRVQANEEAPAEETPVGYYR